MMLNRFIGCLVVAALAIAGLQGANAESIFDPPIKRAEEGVDPANVDHTNLPEYYYSDRLGLKACHQMKNEQCHKVLHFAAVEAIQCVVFYDMSHKCMPDINDPGEDYPQRFARVKSLLMSQIVTYGGYLGIGREEMTKRIAEIGTRTLREHTDECFNMQKWIDRFGNICKEAGNDPEIRLMWWRGRVLRPIKEERCAFHDLYYTYEKRCNDPKLRPQEPPPSAIQ